jgi:hypothetical protein
VYTDGVSNFNLSGISDGATTSVSPSVTTTYTIVSVTNTTTSCSVNSPHANITGSAVITVDNIPLSSLTVGSTIDPVCSGGVGGVTVANSEVGVDYQLRDDSDDSTVGSVVPGNGGTITLSTNALATTTTFNVLAIRGVCSVELTNTVTVNVSGSINGAVTVTPQDNAICEGSATQINISNSETGVNYQLRNDADDGNILTPVAGTGGSISLPTNNLSVTTTFNILASNGTCSAELVTLATVNVDLNPDLTLTVGVTIDPLCTGGTSEITVDNTEAGVSYQLRDGTTNIGSAQTGNGGTLNSLPRPSRRPGPCAAACSPSTPGEEAAS